MDHNKFSSTLFVNLIGCLCAEDGIYLAYSDFHAYLAGDSACTKELNQWFSKQLDTVSGEDIADDFNIF